MKISPAFCVVCERKIDYINGPAPAVPICSHCGTSVTNMQIAGFDVDGIRASESESAKHNMERSHE